MAKNKTEEKEDPNIEEATKPEGQAPPVSAVKGKRFLLFLVPLILLVLAGIGYGVFILYAKPASIPQANKQQDSKAPQYYFVDINNIIVTIASAQPGKKNYLKISLSVQVQTSDGQAVVNAKLPIITDSFQTFLRELRRSDLSGSAGVIMLKAQLLKRINQIVAPQEVEDILFKEIILS